MPTYDYRCEKCENEFEEMLLISKKDEPTETPCTECGGEVKQVVAAPYFGYDNIKTRHSTVPTQSLQVSKLSVPKRS